MEVQLLALLLLLFFDSQKKKKRHPSFLPFPLFDFAQQLPCDLSALPCLSLFNLRRRKGGGGAGHIPAARVEEEKRKIPVPAFACFFVLGRGIGSCDDVSSRQQMARGAFSFVLVL